MAELKTRPNSTDVNDYIQSIAPESKQQDALKLLELFKNVTGYQAVMWGASIVGFGCYEYTNTKGTTRWLMTGFSARKQNFTLYIMQGFSDYQADLKDLGKTKHAKSCLYINKIDQVDIKKLEAFLVKAVADMRKKYQCTEVDVN